MAKPVKQWRVDVEKLIDEDIRDKCIEVQREMMLFLLRGVVMATPVGDKSQWKRNQGKPASKQQPKGYVGGHARKNWQVTINRPAQREVSGEDRAGTQTIGKGKRTIDRIEKLCVAYLTNRLPYITRLDQEAWSSQAREGMTRPTIAALRQRYGLRG